MLWILGKKSQGCITATGLTNVAGTAPLSPNIKIYNGKNAFYMNHTYSDIHNSNILTCPECSSCPCLTWRTKPFSQEIAHSRWPRLLELQFARIAWWICGSTQFPCSLQVCWVQLLGRERGTMYKQNTDTHIEKVRKKIYTMLQNNSSKSCNTDTNFVF